MKRFAAFLLLLAAPVFGAGVSLMPSDMRTLVTLDMSSAILTSSFGGANSSFVTSLSGKSNVCIINGGTTAILGSTNSTSCSAGTSANFAVPGSGSICLERVSLKGAVCLKTESGTIGSGKIYGMFW